MHILNHSTFKQLRAGAYLINVGRGEHLVEEDLLTALQTNQIQAATLDVFSQEPLPSNHPFYAEKRITITPHIATLTFLDETVEKVATLLQAIQQGNGHTLSARINLELGY